MAATLSAERVTGRRVSPAVSVRGLVVHNGHGHLVLGPVTMAVDAGTLALVIGADPAARWALGAAVTGRLPLDRWRCSSGEVEVGSLTTPPMIRTESVLAQSWRIRGIADRTDRRLAALSWARAQPAGLIVLSPGLDGLDDAGCSRVLQSAARIAHDGRTVILTGPESAAGPVERRTVDATITLPPRT